jgi:hypothetical protein
MPIKRRLRRRSRRLEVVSLGYFGPDLFRGKFGPFDLCRTTAQVHFSDLCREKAEVWAKKAEICGGAGEGAEEFLLVLLKDL